MAERAGFEPAKRGLDAYTLSRRAPSTARTPLRWNRRTRCRPAFGSRILAPGGRRDKAWRPPDLCGVQPVRPAFDIALVLPDRNARLHLVDDEAAGGEGGIAVRG